MLETFPRDGADASVAIKAKRKVYSIERGDFVEANVYDADKLKHGNTIKGVAIVEAVGATINVWEDCQLVVDKYGDFEIKVGTRK